MEILHYSINIDKLKNIQKQQTIQNSVEEENIKLQGTKNKKRLLKYVLPFVHSILELHNNKCKLANYSTTGRDGLLGYSKVDIQKELEHIVNTDNHLTWQNNYQTFTFINRTVNNTRNLKIWLNSRDGCHKSTPNLEYSMGSYFHVYGKSIENELESIAKLCSRFTDNW